MSKNDIMEANGKVLEILPGDTVVLELSPYDLTHGRIVYNKK